MIELNHVSKTYGNEAVLKDLHFSIAKGEFLFLTGASGAGKSSLLRVLAGLDLPSGGEIVVDGHSLSDCTPREFLRFRQSVGVVFQDYKLLTSRTVFENIAYPLEIRGVDGAGIKRRVSELLSWVDLSAKGRWLPEQLSGGEQQRVAIARAMVGDPFLLLADEPTGNLDPELALETLRLFDEANQRGVTVMIATHDWHMVERYGRRVVHIQNGRTTIFPSTGQLRFG
jgi:cell division transport system ATP-binding protein